MNYSTAVLYIVFAAIAIIVNLAAQRVVLALLDGSYFSFSIALVVGTLLGLVVKYVLDKRWIFRDTRSGVAVQSKQFGLYSVMGIATTLLFWTFEYSFWVYWQTDFMREVGAVIGLAIGYGVKYCLDRRFVFTDFAQLNSSRA